MTEKKYTEDHEWISLVNDIATIGISKHAVDELGEIVFVELPEIDTEFESKDEFGSIESVKTVSSLYLPVSGKVVDINKTLEDQPEVINESPEENGWIIKINVSDMNQYNELMSEDEYKEYLNTL